MAKVEEVVVTSTDPWDGSDENNKNWENGGDSDVVGKREPSTQLFALCDGQCRISDSEGFMAGFVVVSTGVIRV